MENKKVSVIVEDGQISTDIQNIESRAEVIGLLVLSIFQQIGLTHVREDK